MAAPTIATTAWCAQALTALVALENRASSALRTASVRRGAARLRADRRGVLHCGGPDGSRALSDARCGVRPRGAAGRRPPVLPCPTKKRRSYPTSFPVILRRCRNAQRGPKGRNSAPRALSFLTTNDDALRVNPGPRWPGRTRGQVVEHRPYCAYSRPRERSVPS